MENTMTTTPQAAMPAQARVRMFTGASTGAGALGGQGRRSDSTGVVSVAYTPAIVDVVKHDLPGVLAWSPPV
ncbi:MAG: hypothetical protein GEU96_04135 [Propionibacteriales bacterium]|nr:hypothetical protein [Propionibacteriales bacterium]